MPFLFTSPFPFSSIPSPFFLFSFRLPRGLLFVVWFLPPFEACHHHSFAVPGGVRFSSLLLFFSFGLYPASPFSLSPGHLSQLSVSAPPSLTLDLFSAEFWFKHYFPLKLSSPRSPTLSIRFKPPTLLYFSNSLRAAHDQSTVLTEEYTVELSTSRALSHW